MRRVVVLQTMMAVAAFQTNAPMIGRAARGRVPPPFLADIKAGAQVIAGSDWNSSSPEYGIVRSQAYELQRIYYQGTTDGIVQRVDVNTLEASPPKGCSGFTKYVTLFSQRYHSETGPVIVRPEEVEIVTFQDEVSDSAWLALPGLLWLWLAYTIYEYGEAHGGAFRLLQPPPSL